MKRLVYSSNYIRSDSDVDEAWDSYDPYNGHIYRIDGGYGQTKYTDYPKNALEYWFRMQQKNPADVSVMTRKRSDALKLVDYVANNPKIIYDLGKKFKCPYKLDYLVNESEKKAADGCKWFREGEFGDSIHPFGVG